MATSRREVALRALLAPVQADVRAHLSAYPPRVRACLALTLAAELLGESAALALDAVPSADAARMIELAGRIDGVVADLWPPPGDDHSDDRGDDSGDGGGGADSGHGGTGGPGGG